MKQHIIALTIRNIAILLNLNVHSLNKKSNRQLWPYREERRRGRPTGLYYFDALPDDIQIAFANWDVFRGVAARDREIEKGDKGRPESVPTPITEDDAKVLLGWPLRVSWKADTGKKWDGESRGLCLEARKILSKNFPYFNHIEQGTVDLPEMEPPSPPEETTYPVPKEDTPATVAESSVQYDRVLLESKEKDIAAKDREIELLKLMLDQQQQMTQILQNTITDKDRMIAQQRETIEMKNQELNEKSLEIRDLKREMEAAKAGRTNIQAG